MKRPRVVAIVGAATALAVSSVGWAQEEGSNRARALFLEGRKAARAGDHAGACPKFAESSRLEAAAGTLFNLGDCEEHVGHSAAAWNAYRKGLGLLAKTDDPRRRHVEERLAGLEKRVARLTIRVGPNAPAATAVEQDGQAMAGTELGVELAVEPGSHVIVASAVGYRSQRYEVNLTEGQATELLVNPERSAGTTATGITAVPPESSVAGAPPAPTQAAPQPTTGSALAATTDDTVHGNRAAAIVVGAIGAAGVILGAVTRGIAVGQWSTIDGHCSSDGACDRAGLDAVSSSSTLQTVSAVSFIAGAAGLGLGAYLLLSRSGPSTSAPTQASLGAMMLPGGVGLRFGKGF